LTASYLLRAPLQVLAISFARVALLS